MRQQNLKKLSRSDLLELLLEERRENERLRVELETTSKKLDDRMVRLEKTGSIAEASLQLNGVFEAAEAAAAQYLENIQSLSGEQESVYQRMEAEARKKAEIICTEADEYSRRVRSEADEYSHRVRTEADEYSNRVRSEADEYSHRVRSEADECSHRVRTEADQYQRQVMEKLKKLLEDQDGLRSRLKAHFEEQNS